LKEFNGIVVNENYCFRRHIVISGNIKVCICVCRFQRDSTELEEWMSCAHERVQKWNSFSDSGLLDSRIVLTQIMVT